jgi:hypothetical protein
MNRSDRPKQTKLQRKSGLIVALVFVATVGAAYAQGVSRVVPSGVWGGEHLRVEVTATGATLEYDCANGAITGPIRLDSQGRFSARGSHTAERGGPVRLDDQPASARARYRGVVKGDTMTLTVTLETGKQPLGVFTLTRGGEPLLMKCR